MCPDSLLVVTAFSLLIGLPSHFGDVVLCFRGVLRSVFGVGFLPGPRRDCEFGYEKAVSLYGISVNINLFFSPYLGLEIDHRGILRSVCLFIAFVN